MLEKVSACLLVCLVAIGAYQLFLPQEPVGKPNPAEALALLKAGNERYVKGESTRPHQDDTRRHLAASSSQADYAIATVLSCSDSRAVPELIFDVGIEDIFTVRVAGNVCSEDELGSCEYGVAEVRTPVLVVLGHTSCGAVTAALRSEKDPSITFPPNIGKLVGKITPSVQKTLHDHPKSPESEQINQAAIANVQLQIETLLASSVIREKVEKGELSLQGALYDLQSGKVEWLSP